MNDEACIPPDIFNDFFDGKADKLSQKHINFTEVW
jgi:hypothetical protein